MALSIKLLLILKHFFGSFRWFRVFREKCAASLRAPQSGLSPAGRRGSTFVHQPL